MPQPGHAYTVDADWRQAVDAELQARGITRAELSRRLKCGRTAVSNLLNGTVQGSTLVPAIHAVLGWPAPMPPLASVDVPELSAIYDKLDQRSRDMLLERARTLLEMLDKKP